MSENHKYKVLRDTLHYFWLCLLRWFWLCLTKGVLDFLLYCWNPRLQWGCPVPFRLMFFGVCQRIHPLLMLGLIELGNLFIKLQGMPYQWFWVLLWCFWKMMTCKYGMQWVILLQRWKLGSFSTTDQGIPCKFHFLLLSLRKVANFTFYFSICEINLQIWTKDTCHTRKSKRRFNKSSDNCIAETVSNLFSVFLGLSTFSRSRIWLEWSNGGKLA